MSHPITRFCKKWLVFLVILLPVLASPALAQGNAHVVQAGETLYRIALRYGVTIDSLVQANRLVNPNQIYVGQTLTIPVAGDVTTAEPEAPTTTAPVYHIVQPGETLAMVASQYGVTWQEIADANGLGDPNRILVGQQLRILANAAPDTAAVLPLATTNTVSEAVVSESEAVPFDSVDSAAPEVEAAPVAEAPAVADNQSLVADPPSGFYQPAIQEQAAPAQAEPAAASSESLSVPPPLTSQPRTHTVQPGETLARIAREYGLTWTTVAQANNIVDPNRILVGQQLSIPSENSPGNVTYLEPSTGQPAGPAPTITNGKQIVVDLSAQQIFAYENGELQRQVTVSTGLPGTPTVIGDFNIYWKLDSQTMAGPGYYLPGVPWVMYFYQGYAIHGTYWHNNFGNPMSHGCVNLPTDEASWFYTWAEVGTPVRVVY